MTPQESVELTPVPAGAGGDQLRQALAVRASNGDREAFGAFVAAEYDFLFAVAYRQLRQRELAEDVVQTVCMRLGEAIRQWRGEGSVRTWLYRLIFNASQDALRGMMREKRRVEAFGSYLAIADTGEDAASGEGRLWQQVAQLPDKQREAVQLVYGEGLSHGEAAEIMECAESTVSWHVHAAKKRLRELIEKEGSPA
ncbi:MAG: RNA polymerase sigma factor [Nitratireductor sp.]|nr:RNA polymerase sigma factor [Nitratireductor sp.]